MSEYLDGADHVERRWLKRLACGLAESGSCIVCGVPQPDDVRWPYFTIEFRHKATGDTREIEYCACPSHVDEVRSVTHIAADLTCEQQLNEG